MNISQKQHGKTKYVKKLPDEISKFNVEFLTSSPHKTYTQTILCSSQECIKRKMVKSVQFFKQNVLDFFLFITIILQRERNKAKPIINRAPQLLYILLYRGPR